MDQTILETIKGFSLDAYRPILPRELDLGEPLAPRAGNLVTVVSGMRRSGKTYALLQTMDALVTQGLPPERMLYFNFEDDRLGEVTPATGDAVLEAFWSLSPTANREGAFLFFDELQEMRDWGRWLRRIVDTTRATIFVTGSSSKMLSESFATELRGRSIEYVQYPLSFSEFARWHAPSVDPHSGSWSSAERATLEGLFADYLVRGGFPGIQELDWQRAIAVLQGYARRVVARDVVERHNVGNPQAAAALGTKVLSLCGRPLSLRKTAEELKQAGHGVSRAALSQLTDYLEEAFLVLGVAPRTRSTKIGPNAQVKLYPVDPGLARANMPATSVDSGQVLEDVVAIELFRRQGAARMGAVSSYYAGERRHEVDFCVGDALFSQELGLYQVSWAVDEPAVLRRECRSLWEAMAETGARESTIVIGRGKEQVLERNGLRIRCVPAWRWLLG